LKKSLGGKFGNLEHLEEKLQATWLLLQVWRDVVSFIILSLSAAVSADGILLGFCLLTSSFVFLFGCGSGRTIFKFHHIAKVCCE